MQRQRKKVVDKKRDNGAKVCARKICDTRRQTKTVHYWVNMKSWRLCLNYSNDRAMDVKIRRNFHRKRRKKKTQPNQIIKDDELRRKKCRKGDDVTRDSKFKEIRWFVKYVLKAIVVIDFTVKRLSSIGIFEVKPATTKERKQKKIFEILLLFPLECASPSLRRLLLTLFMNEQKRSRNREMVKAVQ